MKVPNGTLCLIKINIMKERKKSLKTLLEGDFRPLERVKKVNCVEDLGCWMPMAIVEIALVRLTAPVPPTALVPQTVAVTTTVTVPIARVRIILLVRQIPVAPIAEQPHQHLHNQMLLA